MLDFLAMLAGLKPVFLLGRGFDDSSWIEGVSNVASGMNLHVLIGPQWEAEHAEMGLPDWYPEVAPQNKDDRPVFYICKVRSIAIKVKEVCSTGVITIEEEASMLGYPVCCVRNHYRCVQAMNSGYSRMLQRYSKGNIEEMKRIVREDIGMTPKLPRKSQIFGSRQKCEQHHSRASICVHLVRQTREAQHGGSPPCLSH